MPTLKAHITSAEATDVAIAEILGHGFDGPPQLIFTFYGEKHDDQLIHEQLTKAFPGVPLIGGTSSRGVVAAGHLPTRTDLGSLAIYDSGGDYGVGSASLGTDPQKAGREATEMALRHCDCQGITPSLVWLFQPPGQEESVLSGIQQIVGNRCPIVGGSAADDTVEGRWRQLSTLGVSQDSVCVAVLFSSSALTTAFQSGYAPTGKNGVVTQSEGRMIASIDGRPAASVYREWHGGELIEAQERDGSILGATALNPLGIPSRNVYGTTQHALVHPAKLSDEGGLCTFAEVHPGQTVEFMVGSPESLANRAGRVLSDSIAMLPRPETFAGGLVIFCGGCAMSLGDRMQSMTQGLESVAKGKPIIGAFTFGEQGMLGDACVHANLMVSATAFSE